MKIAYATSVGMSIEKYQTDSCYFLEPESTGEVKAKCRNSRKRELAPALIEASLLALVRRQSCSLHDLAACNHGMLQGPVTIRPFCSVVEGGGKLPLMVKFDS
jgi:hypothetical protein